MISGSIPEPVSLTYTMSCPSICLKRGIIVPCDKHTQSWVKEIEILQVVLHLVKQKGKRYVAVKR